MNKNVPGVIDHWPSQTAPIGPGTGDSPMPRFVQDIAGQWGFGLNPNDFNGREGRGPAGWDALLSKAWDQAVAQGRSMLMDPKSRKTGCGCESVTIVFLGSGDDAKKYAGDFHPPDPHDFNPRGIGRNLHIEMVGPMPGHSIEWVDLTSPD